MSESLLFPMPDKGADEVSTIARSVGSALLLSPLAVLGENPHRTGVMASRDFKRSPYRIDPGSELGQRSKSSKPKTGDT